MSPRLRALVLGGFLAVGGSFAGCRGDDPGKSDEAVLIMLSEARAHQRLADLKLADGDVEGAIASVREVLLIRFPPGAPETEDVFLDAHARLARLVLSRGGAEAEERALAELETARRLATRDSFFRSHIENLTPRSTRPAPSGSPTRPSRSRRAARKRRPWSASSRSIAVCSMHSLTPASLLAISRGPDVCLYLGRERPDSLALPTCYPGGGGAGVGKPENLAPARRGAWPRACAGHRLRDAAEAGDDDAGGRLEGAPRGGGAGKEDQRI